MTTRALVRRKQTVSFSHISPGAGASHLECTLCSEIYPSEVLQTVSACCARPLYPRYDFEAIRRRWDRDAVDHGPANLWRYAEVLPLREPRFAVQLGEGWTPLLAAPRLAAEVGVGQVWIKDESQNPTASFKARGLCVAISRARELGAGELALPSAGNAGAAAAAYAAAAGLCVHVVVPRATPPPILAELEALGAEFEVVDGLITDCGLRVAEGVRTHGWFDLSTLREPYRVEGKKTLGYELAQQLGWALPDAIVYPTGGGTGLVGMWKAFDELEQLRWIGSARPKMIAVQASGCAPIVRAWEHDSDFAEHWEEPNTYAAGIRVPRAIGDFLILRAIRDSGGVALAVSDPEMREWTGRVGRATGLFCAPEGAATAAALPHLRARGVLSASDSVVLFNTGSGLKYAGG